MPARLAIRHEEHRRSSTPVLLGMAAVLLLSTAATWGAIPWDWTFPLFYLALALFLELVARTVSRDFEQFLQCAVLSGSVPFVFSWFFGDAWHGAAPALHLASVAGLGLLAGHVMVRGVRVSAAGRGL